jgi:hypothetical protein
MAKQKRLVTTKTGAVHENRNLRKGVSRTIKQQQASKARKKK